MPVDTFNANILEKVQVSEMLAVILPLICQMIQECDRFSYVTVVANFT
jgi:hypothetical protein